jgi:hypothetical protein
LLFDYILNYSKNLSFEENWAKQGDEIADL